MACTIHPDGKIHATENADDVLEELNKSLGFNIKQQPDKVASVLEEAILSHDATDIECALHIAYTVGFRPVFMPLLITMLELTWHYSHEGIVDTFQYLKAPEPVEVLYRTALVEHEYRAYDEFFGLARKCTYALRDIGTPEAHEKLRLLTKCDNKIIAGYAQEHLHDFAKELRANYLRRVTPFPCEALAIAEAILKGEVDIVQGSRSLVRFAGWWTSLADWWWSPSEWDENVIEEDWTKYLDAEFNVFRYVQMETLHFPTSEVCCHWSKEALQKKDAEIAIYEAEHQDRVIEACTRIIKRFSEA